MDLFYKNTINAGVLHVVSVPGLVGTATLKFINPAPQGKTFVTNALITSLSYNQRTNTQFQQSLDNIVYVYSFGDQMGDLTLSGLAFARSCDGTESGIVNVLNFYRNYKASKSVSQVEIVFANEVIRSYLVGIALSTADPSSGLHNFNLMLKTVPAVTPKTTATTGDQTASSYTQQTAANSASVRSAAR